VRLLLPDRTGRSVLARIPLRVRGSSHELSANRRVVATQRSIFAAFANRRFVATQNAVLRQPGLEHGRSLRSLSARIPLRIRKPKICVYVRRSLAAAGTRTRVMALARPCDTTTPLPLSRVTPLPRVQNKPVGSQSTFYCVSGRPAENVCVPVVSAAELLCLPVPDTSHGPVPSRSVVTPTPWDLPRRGT
jgi:hypothetical protein